MLLLLLRMETASAHTTNSTAAAAAAAGIVMRFPIFTRNDPALLLCLFLLFTWALSGFAAAAAAGVRRAASAVYLGFALFVLGWCVCVCCLYAYSVIYMMAYMYVCVCIVPLITTRCEPNK
jgi:hypothetical protein